jgi:hypothetical protein
MSLPTQHTANTRDEHYEREFERAISGIKGTQSYALDRTAIRINGSQDMVGQNYHTVLLT